MYSVDEIKELLKAFDTSKATKLEIVNEKGEALTFAQKTEGVAVSAPVAVPAVPAAAAAPAEKQTPSPFIHQEEAPASEGEPVTSPMVGVFYAAPSPDKEAYVSVGRRAMCSV